MGTIVQLSAFRKARKPVQEDAVAQEPPPHYFCQRCDTDQFKLYASGLVHCANCAALMRNIVITAESSSKDSSR
jgi:ribosomal protein L37AE/L43A